MIALIEGALAAPQPDWIVHREISSERREITMFLEVKARILIVDDGAGSDYALKLLLELDGYEIIIALARVGSEGTENALSI